MTEPDRSFDDCIGQVTDRLGFLWKRVAALEIRAGAKFGVDQFKAEIIALFDQPENLDGFPHDLRADSVTCQ